MAWQWLETKDKNIQSWVKQSDLAPNAQENQRQQKEQEGEVWQIVPTQINIPVSISTELNTFYCDHKAGSWDGPGVGCQLYFKTFFAETRHERWFCIF